MHSMNPIQLIACSSDSLRQHAIGILRDDRINRKRSLRPVESVSSIRMVQLRLEWINRRAIGSLKMIATRSISIRSRVWHAREKLIYTTDSCSKLTGPLVNFAAHRFLSFEPFLGVRHHFLVRLERRYFFCFFGQALHFDKRTFHWTGFIFIIVSMGCSYQFGPRWHDTSCFSHESNPFRTCQRPSVMSRRQRWIYHVHPWNRWRRSLHCYGLEALTCMMAHNHLLVLGSRIEK